jgi:glycosyltransferase involved in cell wall biosynthesis
MPTANMPRSVTLIDPMILGHHAEYAATLVSGLHELGVTCNLVGRPEFVEAVVGQAPVADRRTVEYRHGKGLSAENRKVSFLVAASRAANGFGSDIAHLLFLDRFILATARATRCFEMPVVGTLHWAYMSRALRHSVLQGRIRALERYFLAQLGHRGYRLLVHGDWIANSLLRDTPGLHVDRIPYPARQVAPRASITMTRQRYGLPPEAKVLLAFGATRLDKGGDVAVRALRYLPENVHLLVAGRPAGFTERDLRQIAAGDGTEHRLHLAMQFIDDQEVADLFSSVDIVILPYRRRFSGQSGPLVQAASQGIPVVASDLPVLSETVNRFELGTTFEGDSASELARTVLETIDRAHSPMTQRFREAHSISSFARAVRNSYEQALTGGLR